MEKPITVQRTRPITVICIIGFIGACFSVPMIFSDSAATIGSWYRPYLALATVVGLISFGGLWKMKKWGLLLYAAFSIVTQIVFLIQGKWIIGMLLFPALVIAIVFTQFKKMN